jgi:hypothetical protein
MKSGEKRWVRMKKLVVSPKYADSKLPTVQIAFKILVDPSDVDFAKYEGLFPPSWFWMTRKVEVSECAVSGKVDFYDKEHGHLDAGNIVDVPLSAQLFFNPRWWLFRKWTRLELSGVSTPVPLYCFSGWGILRVWAHSKMLNCDLTTKFNTFRLPS